MQVQYSDSNREHTLEKNANTLVQLRTRRSKQVFRYILNNFILY